MSITKVDGLVGRTDLFKADPRKIKVKYGFNPRTMFSLVDLKESIKANGFWFDKPLLLHRAEGELVLVDGERRLRAVLELIDEGEPILTVPAVLSASHNDADLLARAVAANSGAEPLEPLDEARAFNRLINYGWSASQIAAKVGRSLMYVYGRLKLLEASDEVLDALSTGEITLGDAQAVVTAGQSGKKQSDVLESVVKLRKEKKEQPKKVRHALKASDDRADNIYLREILQERGVAWVVAQLLEYADKSEVLDAIRDAAEAA